jgi:hypothetical protein
MRGFDGFGEIFNGFWDFSMDLAFGKISEDLKDSLNL